MENASKALIIAGAILLSILIISLGIMVYQNAKNTVGNANLNKQEIETFNSQWETYIGENKTAAEVRSMVQAVIASNASETKSGQNRIVNVNNSKPSTTATGLSNSKTYKIDVAYDGTSGLVTNITYSENGATGGTGGTTP